MKIGFHIIWTRKVLEDTVYCLCVCRHNKAIFMHGAGRRPMLTALWVWLQLFRYRESSRTVHPFSVRRASSGNVRCFYLTNLFSSPPWSHFKSPHPPHATDPSPSCQKSQLNAKPKLQHCSTQETLRVWGQRDSVPSVLTLVILQTLGTWPVFPLFVHVFLKF